MHGLEVKLDSDSTWLCGHVAQDGGPAPSTRLRLDQTLEWNPGHSTSAPRRSITCPDCDTIWRVWPTSAMAKPSAEWNAPGRRPANPRYRRAPILDIDRIIDVVKRELPAIQVLQHFGTWPADDEGLWFFRLPTGRNEIQLESSSGMCPYLVEHSDMASGDAAGRANTPEEAAQTVINYLSMKEIRPPRGPEELLQYFEIVNRAYPDEHWRNGADMCRRWLSFAGTQSVSQREIDEFIARLAAEPNAGSGWFDLGLQFKHWAHARGFSV